MAAGGERWPPVYELEDLVREIKRLTSHPDIATEFYAWRCERSTYEPGDVCQGDIVSLVSDVPVLLEDGQPGTMEHPTGSWLVIGNTCDFAREVDEVRWTQLVPVLSLGTTSELSPDALTAARKYTKSRSFFVPPWKADVEHEVHVADLLRPIGVDKRALQGPIPKGVVEARMSRAAWILLNACLVRFLARDDGRYD